MARRRSSAISVQPEWEVWRCAAERRVEGAECRRQAFLVVPRSAVVDFEILVALVKDQGDLADHLV